LGGLVESITTSDKDSCTKDGYSIRPLNAWFAANSIAAGWNSRKQGPSKLTFSTKALINEALDTSIIQLRGGGPSPKTKGKSLQCDDDVVGSLLSHGTKIRVEPKEKGWDGISACALVLDNEGESVIHFHVCFGKGASSNSCKDLTSLGLGDSIDLGCEADGGWRDTCPPNDRCLEVKNNCPYPTTVSYPTSCNGGGDNCKFQYAPQASPDNPLQQGSSIFYPITDGPGTCWTHALYVMPNKASDCKEGSNEYNCLTCGTRMEITAGITKSSPDDQYNIDVEKTPDGSFCNLPQNTNNYYSIPVKFRPDISDKGTRNSCGSDGDGNNCRPLYCNNFKCADAYCTQDTICPGCPTSTNIKQPQAACQESFNNANGYIIDLCPTEPIPPALTDTKGSCQQRCCCGFPIAPELNKGMIYPTPAECANTVCTAP
jgi:hypothetical protein